MTEERVALLPRMVTMRDAIEALAEQLAPESARLHAVTPPSRRVCTSGQRFPRRRTRRVSALRAARRAGST